MYKTEFQHLYEIERVRIPQPENVSMRLQRLEKPNNWSSDLLNKIYRSIPDELLNQYPDNFDFYHQLSEFIGVPVENIVVTSGIDEPIKSLMTLCCYPGDKIAVTWPGYAMYDVYARIFDVKLSPVIYDPYTPMSAQEFLSKVPTDAKILFLPNPSQPVENCFSLDELETIAAWCHEREMIFAIDEAYHYFGGPDALQLITRFNNVLIMRTFSKAFGAASIRLGYVAGASEAIAPLNAFRLAHEANAYSLHVASTMLANFEKLIKPAIVEVCKGRDYLRDKIKEDIGLTAWGETSNCVLIDMGNNDKAASVADALKSRGIYIKANFPSPLERYLLVTCGDQELMAKFYDNFKELYEAND